MNKEEQVQYTLGEEILGNLGFWPIVLGILALVASFVVKSQSFWLLPLTFGLMALAKLCDGVRYIIYRKDRPRGIRSLSLCVLLVGLAVTSPKLVEIFALWR